MRISKREQILDAALTVVEHDGVAAVTFESVAAIAGLTKGGLLYHFPTKDAMLLALHEHLAAAWSDDMQAVLGKAPETATAVERVAAYVRVSARSATGPELRLMLEATSSPEFDAPWKRVLEQWVPDPASLDPNDPEQMRLLMTRLAADGLWMADSLNAHPLPARIRRALADQLANALTSEALTTHPTTRTADH